MSIHVTYEMSNQGTISESREDYLLTYYKGTWYEITTGKAPGTFLSYGSSRMSSLTSAA